MATAMRTDERELLARNLIQDIRLYICGPCDDDQKKELGADCDPELHDCNCDKVAAPLSSLKRICGS